MRIALAQILSGTDPAANLELVDRHTREAAEAGASLVLFPEATMCRFGVPLAPVAEPLDGRWADGVRAIAERSGVTVVAGMFETSEDPGRPFNTLLVRGAVEAAYRKVHLYDSFGYRESDRLSAGPLDEPGLVGLGGFTVGLMTCYDLRFPELARRLVDAGADLLVVPAAWVAGERKVDHWRTLVRARAIENTVFVAACGQPAPRYSGHSMVVDPLGDVLAEAGDDADLVRVSIDTETLAEARRTNPSLANRRL